jgi:UDP-glucose 4-epimerase
MMHKVLITGGNGKLGRYVCAELASNCDVTVFDRVSPETDVRSIQGDVLDLSALRQAARAQDAIVHLAGIPSPRHGSSQEIFVANTVGTWTVLQAALLGGVRRVVICSSDCVTGLLHQPESVMPSYLPIDELHPLHPTEAYGLSKQLSEEAGHCFARCGLEIIILRPGLIVFPEMRQQVPLWGADPNNPDLWWYVEPADVAIAFRLAIELSSVVSQTFFIGAANTFSLVPTLELVKNRYGQIPEIRKPEVFRSDPHAALFDTSHARTVLGFSPTSDWRRWTDVSPST